jgi:(5-formylfuran-3-yl)methyl phosphate synthase
VKLLVSVRNPAEAGEALRGGAELVDAKDPARGPLGPLDPVMVNAILAALPASVPFSVALGDPASKEEVVERIGSLGRGARSAPVYLKLGFGGAADLGIAGELLRVAVAEANRHPAKPAVVAVTYADRAGSGLDAVSTLAAGEGAQGVLVDTASKAGGSLFDHLSPESLAGWVERSRRRGLVVAVAGSLRQADLPAVAATGADIAGIRGAACIGGRAGPVDSGRVRLFRAGLHACVAEAKGPAAKHQTSGRPADPTLPRTRVASIG